MRKVFIFFSIILAIILIRLYLYEYNVLKVNKFQFENKLINIPLKGSVVLINKGNINKIKVYSINISFLTIYNKLNLDFILKYLSPTEIVLFNKKIVINIYSKKSKEFKNFKKNINLIKKNNLYEKVEIKSKETIGGCEIFFYKNNLIEILNKSDYYPLIKIYDKNQSNINFILNEFCK